MHIILTGATGNVGAPALTYCLQSPIVTQLSILSRRTFPLPEGTSSDKARIIVHSDFSSYPDELLSELKGAQGCIWAQGISQSEVSKAEYERITYDYPIAAAKAFSTLPEEGKSMTFVYVSGEGADQTEKAWSLFARIKGRAEKDLITLQSSYPGRLNIYNVRPGAVTPSQPGRRNLAFRALEAVLVPTFKAIAPGMVSPVGELAKVLHDLAVGDGKALPEKGLVGIEDQGRLVRSAGVRAMYAAATAK